MYKADSRYDSMVYNRCGKSGLNYRQSHLAVAQLGGNDIYENAKEMTHKAFDLGITHFDLANNYSPPYGSAETNFGQILKEGLNVYRDELIISSKAGYDMWPGPYGEWGSKKYLVASCDQSLKRMGLDYVDIFYSHRFDPELHWKKLWGRLITSSVRSCSLRWYFFIRCCSNQRSCCHSQRTWDLSYQSAVTACLTAGLKMAF